MPLESIGSHIDEWPSLKDSPEYLKKLDERVKKVEQDEKNYKHLVKVNDVLNVLDFPDNKEEAFRKVLETQDQTTLKELAWKSKNEILLFIVTAKENTTHSKEEKAINVEAIETEKQDIKIENIEQKLSKIKSIFSPEILKNNPDIAQKFEALELAPTPEQKEAILQGILNLLQEPWVLKSIIKDLWWADKNNPKYVEFRNTLIDVDPSFENVFSSFENLNHSINSTNNEIIDSIEKDSEWLMKIDLNSDTPTSKMSLVWSEYSFTENLDKQALTNINEESIDKLTAIDNSFTILKGLYKPFGSFINQIKQDLWKQDFKQTIKSTISNFSQDIFSGLDEHYETLGIESSMQLSEADIRGFSSIDSPNDLQQHIDRITAKFQNIEAQVWKMKTWVLKNHQIQMKELLDIKAEQKEKQKKVLEFLKKSGFDLIPKEITNKIIRELQSNTLTIPWLDLSVKNIDIKNWNFWESWAFIDKEAWINIQAKKNILKFMNKMITWSIKEPLSVDGISSWTSIADPNFLKGKFLEVDIVGGMWWKYNSILENLKKVN